MATLFGVCFNAFVLTSVLADRPPSPTALLALVALNGGASGLIQSLSPRLGGDLPTTRATAVGSLQLVGVSLAQWMPCIIQAALLPLAAQPGQAHATVGLAAKLSLGGAGLICLAALAALRLLLASCHDGRPRLCLGAPRAVAAADLLADLHRRGCDHLPRRHLAEAAGEHVLDFLADVPGNAASDEHQYFCLLRPFRRAL